MMVDITPLTELETFPEMYVGGWEINREQSDWFLSLVFFSAANSAKSKFEKLPNNLGNLIKAHSTLHSLQGEQSKESQTDTLYYDIQNWPN